MSANIELKGVGELRKALQKKADITKVKTIVAKNGAKLQELSMRNAIFKGHYKGNVFVPPTGFTKRSIELELQNGGMSAKVEAKSEYSGYLEHGTRFMAAQPFIGPAFRQVETPFLQEIKNFIKEE